MAKLHVERIGGIANFGGSRSHIRSRGEVDVAALSSADQKAVEALFRSGGSAKGSSAPDAFRYRISRSTANGVETVEVPEEMVPAAVSQSVRDEFV